MTAEEAREELLRVIKGTLRHRLQYTTHHRAVTDDQGKTVNSFCCLGMPDWEAKQLLDKIEAVISN